MKLLTFLLLLGCGSTAITAEAGYSKKIKACYPNCGRHYHGYDPKHPYFIHDLFKKHKKPLKLAQAAPAPIAPSIPPPPPPPPPPVDPCIEHICSPSY